MIVDVVAAQRFDAGAHRNTIGLFLLERAALTLGVGTGRFVGGQALADHVRGVLELGLDRVVDIGIGEQLDPRDARRGIRFAQLGEVGGRRQIAHLRHEVARLLLIRVLVGGTALRRRGRGLARLQQRARLLLRGLGARLLGDRGQRVR
jgi:hypothetical protein